MRVSAHQEDGQAVIAVQDSGVGIPADALPHILEPLYSTKARGLGLALPFERFTVSTNPDAPALLIADDDDPGRWTLRDLDAGPGYAAALAVTGGLPGVSTWEWTPDLSAR